MATLAYTWEKKKLLGSTLAFNVTFKTCFRLLVRSWRARGRAEVPAQPWAHRHTDIAHGH